ncbi:MAG: hypothetical protein EZS28_052730 [Streblomastix strix]|uniref:HECT domain-containing protein n=1 Tax=Streblomastix strix TaxID=222440 RepID=A0A5J4RVS6_9EUKA|nr:MAG: hypothetical protein EZS28_052730 [Streblomastix strix]
MTSKQRQLFLRFVTGRSRIPRIPQITDDMHSIHSELQVSVELMGSRSLIQFDRTLPASHTCNQSLELPQYSSADIMLERFIYAITNCVSIDTDFTPSGGFRDDAFGQEEENEDIYSDDENIN